MKIHFKKIIYRILRFQSKLVLAKYKPKIIVITGSVGKTSTKDAVFAVLSRFTYVRKSAKSYNSEIGLPLTILGLPNAWNNPLSWMWNIVRGFWLIIYPHKYPKTLVLEVGVGKPGDMAETASWLKTDIVIETAIGETPVHIEFFNSRDHLIAEKSALIKTLKKEGTLILNRDDESVYDMRLDVKNKIITFGFDKEAVISAENESIFYGKDKNPEGLSFHVNIEGKSLPVVLRGVFGRNHIYASLVGLSVAKAWDLNMIEAISALETYNFPPGRLCLLYGINDSLILDDTYNSSPTALKFALQTLKEIKNKGRNIAVLGDMLQLGRHTEEAHREIGALVAKVADVLVVVGPRAKFIKEEAEKYGMGNGDFLEGATNVFEFNNSREAGDFLHLFVKKGDLVLVKGSQGMRMERAVERILKDTKNKSHLLVRQEREWLKRG